ncbi:NAD(P)/FAD-dependent oxidoreductase [Paracoccus albus]|uniref:NAD(P)/FAD-dependent oxidoreductase n=1 Tax=Paracoccus albus TaxID=3017784 RepID=UPI0022F12BD4|nr:FAD-binding oxidoreductase [Paracoccus albus]WBU60872.1 FAD-binding oxidoreductase [Paracoccus albus]
MATSTTKWAAIPSLDHVQSAPRLPEAVDICVIGGGIAGTATALFLAEAGYSVCLCEKGRIAGEQSSRNWGWTRQMGRDPLEMPLTIQSLNLWRNLQGRFGIDAGYRETGIVYLCKKDWEVEQAKGWAQTGRQYGLPLQELSQAEMKQLVPDFPTSGFYGLHTSSDGLAEPSKAVPAMAEASRRLGATILQDCAVRGVETEAGQVSGVVTERGAIRCSRVVVAGGVWSRLFLGNLGVDFPQLKLLATAARIENNDGGPRLPVGTLNFGLRPRLDGGFTLGPRNRDIAPIVPDSFRLLPDFLPVYLKSWRQIRLRLGREFLSEWAIRRNWSLDQSTPFEEMRILNPEPPVWLIRKTLRNLRQTVPAFANARLTHAWSGIIDATPDGVPVIDKVASVPGLFIASGLSGHGFGAGPAVGQMMAEIVMGKKTTVDASPFALGRFRTSRKAAQPALDDAA